VPARRDFRRQVEDWHYLEKGSGDSFSTRYFVPQAMLTSTRTVTVWLAANDDNMLILT
jgi:hypothetical protein